jgi:heme/copper-type cytochrome/quinol oxidase subunit 4
MESGISASSEVMMGSASGMFIGMAIMFVLVVIPFWSIFGKAGHPKWLALLMLIPLVNVVTLYYLAFSKWPAQRQGL